MRDFATSDDPAVQAQLERLASLSLPQGRFGLETRGIGFRPSRGFELSDDRRINYIGAAVHA